MKDLQLKSEAFKYVLYAFREWLETLGYSEQSVYGIPLKIRYFFEYLEERNITQIEDIDTYEVDQYFNHLNKRANKRRAGGLSGNTLKKEAQALQLLLEYFRKVGRLTLERPILKIEGVHAEEIETLSIGEVKRLFRETEEERDSLEVLKSRDRAMLVVYYSAGLRRKEGEMLDVSDINWEQSYLTVRYGKNYTNRKVPLNKTNLKYLEDYVYNYRPKLMKDPSNDALFLSMRGKRVQSQSLYLRLKRLCERIGCEPVGLHTLRHSIATHLLDNGMSVELISRFLGHRTLEATQIYTHVEQPFKNLRKYQHTQLHEDE